MRKTTLLKKLILDDEILMLPGAHNGVAAKIIEQVGFKAVTLGGYAASASFLGKPDVSLLTLMEMITLARNIVEAVDIPVFIDADTGYGNVNNVIRTVREIEKTGAAGLFIEDQLFPKRCGHMEGKQVISTEEMIPKIKAAVGTRMDQDFIIMARTDALAVHGIGEAIERVNRYQEAGADLIFIEAMTTEEEMLKVSQEVNAPKMASMIEGARTPMFTAKQLQEMGYNVVVFAVSTVYAEAWAVRKLMEELHHTGTTSGYMDKMVLFDDFNSLVGLEKIRETEALYYRGLFKSLSKNK